jgi:hypothetical protein
LNSLTYLYIHRWIMVDLRSETTTGGDNPRTPGTRDPNIPESIEVANQVDHGGQILGAIQDQGQPPAAVQGVYLGGTYPETLARTAQGTPAYRPTQFAFTTP